MNLTLHQETRHAAYIRKCGILAWLLVVCLGVIFANGDLFGAGGAVGLCFLLGYVFIERRKIADQLEAMKRHFGDTYKAVQQMTTEQFEKLSEEDQDEINEAGSDIGSFETAYHNDLKRVERRELLLAIALTLQWAFGNVVFDLLKFLHKSWGAV